MISKRGLIKLGAIAVIVLIGALYWYYAEKKSSPIEAVEQSASQQY